MSIEALIDDPSSFDFYQAVYTLQRQLAGEKQQFRKIGFDSLPRHELIRFKSEQHLGFPGQAIAAVKHTGTDEEDKICVEMLVSFMGLTGPSGVLPRHYSELILQRLKFKDTGMRDFYDVFNHRLISLFYRAWEKYRFAINFQSSADFQGDKKQTPADPFSRVLSCLCGGEGIKQYYAGIFSKQVRSADGLQQILAEFTGAGIRIEQFQGKWQYLPESEQTRLGGRQQPEGQYACLGVDACIGSRVWDINASIAVHITPKTGQAVKAFLPGEASAESIKQVIKAYLGDAVKVKILLHIKQKDVPPAQLSGAGVPLGLGCGLLSREEKQNRPCILALS
ncbi:type VI secretion system baseplate subunit TssG [Thalassomonas viridans]|uniref:Type VI secretion system baseplate subunit TssG n=1 Tax=Thalassomonas viridans TaxID=137584 RepID=A0AAF0C7X3_9GAMM|nr:type VI secretion system baseplate subunit TssG [Thalassomonas viridans]WDE03284.1 type VI secretion system baseplate subunit TssG [Thalassomonas viridans]